MSDHHHSTTEQDYGTGQKTSKIYLIGFALCIFLTLIPFAMVAEQLVKDKFTLYVSLMVLAVIQLYVQVVCFLRLNGSSKARWHLASFLFTVIVILTIVCGSLWIMYSLNYNMGM